MLSSWMSHVMHEKELLYTIQKYFKDKIVITISHRMSTLTNANRIIEIVDGKCQEKG